MSEYGEFESEEAMLQAVRDEQNEREEKYRDGFLRRFMFHDHAVLRNDYDNGGLSIMERVALQEQFMFEKAGKNMGQMFDMALSPNYLDRIQVVELGRTTKPGNDGEIDGLKADYNDLRRWMIEHDIIDDELPRQDSGRFFDVRRSDVTPERMVVGRNRPLVLQTLKDVNLPNGSVGDIQIEIAKRMVFSIPSRLYLAFRDTKKDPHLRSEESMAAIETMLQRHDRNIDSIRTAYYLRTQII